MHVCVCVWVQVCEFEKYQRTKITECVVQAVTDDEAESAEAAAGSAALAAAGAEAAAAASAGATTELR